MIFVSTRFPEEIPWFKASRRAVVAAMSVGARVGGTPSVIGRIYNVFMVRQTRSFRVNVKPSNESKMMAAARFSGPGHLLVGFR